MLYIILLCIVYILYQIFKKTTAHRRFKDDVPEDVKNDRLQRMVAKFREVATLENQRFVGREEMILVEGVCIWNILYLVGYLN